MRKGQLIILSAPSGGGKTSLAKALVASDPNLSFSVSYTTRPPRPGEQHGVHYYYVNPEQFERLAAAGEFLEHAQVFGHRYGTSRTSVEAALRAGKRVILDIDWQGARAVKAQRPDAVSIFILPPSREVLRARLAQRAQDPSEVVERRMHEALSEMRHYDEFDHVVVNDDFQAALNDLQAIILGKGRARAMTLDVPTLLRE